MRVFIALAVFAVGVALYAAGALLFDRRTTARRWLARRRAPSPTPTTPGAGTAATQTAQASTTPVYVAIGSCLLLGTLLMCGSCAGLIVL